MPARMQAARPSKSKAAKAKFAGVMAEPQSRLTLNIPEDLHRKFKSVSAARGQRMVGVVKEAIKSYIQENA